MIQLSMLPFVSICISMAKFSCYCLCFLLKSFVLLCCEMVQVSVSVFSIASRYLHSCEIIVKHMTILTDQLLTMVF